MFSTDFIFRQQEILLTTKIVRLDSGHYAAKYYDSLTQNLMSIKALPSYTPITYTVEKDVQFKPISTINKYWFVCK